MKAEWRPGDLAPEEKDQFWRENIRVVEGILSKYAGEERPMGVSSGQTADV
jgi:hypothetical protein